MIHENEWWYDNDTWTWMMIWQCVEINLQLIWILNYLLYSKLKSQIRQALQDSTGASESSQFYIAQLFKNKRLFTILNGTLSRETITPSLHFKTEEQKQNQLRSSRIIVFSSLPYWKCSKLMQTVCLFCQRGDKLSVSGALLRTEERKSPLLILCLLLNN